MPLCWQLQAQQLHIRTPANKSDKVRAAATAMTQPGGGSAFHLVLLLVCMYEQLETAKSSARQRQGCC
jgi:hypothetical protein